MRITLSLVLTVGLGFGLLGFGLAQPAWSQTKQNAWQRLTGVFKSKNQNDDAKDAKKEPKVEVRVSPPANAQEGRGVVFIEEPRTPTRQATGWASTNAKAPVIRTTTAPVTTRDVSPAPVSPPRIVEPAAPIVQPRIELPPTPSNPPRIVESAAPTNPPRIIAPPVTAPPVPATPVIAAPVSPPRIVEVAAPMNQPRIVAPPVTATPVSYPKAVAPLPSTQTVVQPQTLVLPTAPAKTAKMQLAGNAQTAGKAPVAGRDVSRLTRHVSQACPKARNVKLVFTSATEVTVEMDVTTMDECNRHAEQIFAIRELDPYRVNLKFNVPQN